ncbi:hypothetical protein Scep_014334 [Stephania cephalantha]|uniref:Uncharacterized protein n=1 Tax=Stephania cephalantha TaxID=152367 RepID=A0AAP0J142_9MAGN
MTQHDIIIPTHIYKQYKHICNVYIYIYTIVGHAYQNLKVVEMGWVLIFDVIVLPLCVLLFLGYHAFLCYSYRNKPHLTTIGLSAVRRAWPSSIIEDESKSMLVAQSLRNTIMGSVLSAVVATA